MPGARHVSATQLGARGRRERNDRTIALPAWNDRLGDVRDHRNLPPRMRQEIEQFFATTTFFTGKEVRREGWASRKAAEALVRASRA